MSTDSFDDYWRSYEGAFKKSRKSIISDHKQILRFFYTYPGSITAKNLQKELTKNGGEEIRLPILKGRLKSLSKKGILYTSGKKRIFMRDLATDKISFGPDIGKVLLKSLQNLFKDAEEREIIMSIVQNNCDIQGGDIDMMCDLFQSLEKPIELYNLIVREIKAKGVYDENNEYDELVWQNMANRYSNPSTRRNKK